MAQKPIIEQNERQTEANKDVHVTLRGPALTSSADRA
jgi:hypothetical protein